MILSRHCPFLLQPQTDALDVAVVAPHSCTPVSANVQLEEALVLALHTDQCVNMNIIIGLIQFIHTIVLYCWDRLVVVEGLKLSRGARNSCSAISR